MKHFRDPRRREPFGERIDGASANASSWRSLLRGVYAPSMRILVFVLSALALTHLGCSSTTTPDTPDTGTTAMDAGGGRTDTGPDGSSANDTGATTSDTGTAEDTGTTQSDAATADDGGGTIDDAATADDAATPTDGGQGIADSGLASDAGTDGGAVRTDSGLGGRDAGDDANAPACGGGTIGVCARGLSCECCPAGGPQNRCVCSTTCMSDADCTDPSRPVCQQPSPTVPGFCAPRALTCCWLCG